MVTPGKLGGFPHPLLHRATGHALSWIAVNVSRRRILGLLVAALLLAVGTPAYLALSGAGANLLHPEIFAVQTTPYLLAAVLWLPVRSAPSLTAGQWVAGLLLLTAAVLYLPMVTALVPMGGDMVGLAFTFTTGITLVVLAAATVIAHAVLYLRRRGARDRAGP